MPDLRLVTGAWYDRLRRWRRAMATQNLPVVGLGHDLLKVAPRGGPAHFTMALQVSTLNYSTRPEREQDAIDTAYQTFLNNLHHPICWRFSVRQIDPALLSGPLARRMAEVADAHVRRWLRDQHDHLNALVDSHEIPQAALHMLVPLQPPAGLSREEEWQHVRREASTRAMHLVNALKPIGLGARRLGDRELAALVWADLNPDLVLTHKEPPWPALFSMGARPDGIGLVELHHHDKMGDALDLGAQTVPDCLAARDLEFHKWYMEVGRQFRCVLAVQGWPAFMQPNALRHLTNSNLNLDVALHLTPFETSDVLGFLDRRINQLTLSTEKDRLEGYTADHRVVRFIDQARYCREVLEQGRARWFFTALYVSVTSRSLDRLEQDVRTVETLLNQSSLKAAPIYRQQRDGLYTTMPLAVDLLQFNRNMLTDGVANLAPFDCQVYMQEGGFYAGLSRLNNSVVALNVWGLDNYNVCVLGLPGKGKTMWERHKLTYHHCMTDDHQVIGDPDGEMDAMVEALGGTVVRLGAGSPHRINLMDLTLDWDNNSQDYRRGRPLDRKVDQLLAWLEHYLGTPAGQDGERRFTPLEQARVKHALVRVYGRYGITPENQADILRETGLVPMPTLDDLQDELGTSDRNLGDAMDIFRFGAMAIFNARTNVDVTNRLVSINLRDLDPATRDMAMPWVVNWMWGRVGLNRARRLRTHVYFEEILAFLSNPIAAEYVSMIWTRGRKWWCSPCGVSQLIFRLLENSVGRTIVKSSDLKVLFDQGDAIDDVTGELRLSPQEAGFVRSSQPGDGLYVIGPWRVPFRLALSRYQYEYYSTRPGEMKE